ncbi:retrovirus-related pol polyprotein from transposon TNT 1-94 [Tanacetum coccineum]
MDDYSRYTWVYFLHSKDETPEIIKKFIAQAQLNYKAKVCKIRTDNGTEFKNATLKAHYEKLGIMQQFSTARTPQQNGVVERRNRTLVEVARTMLIFSRLPEFLWAEALMFIMAQQQHAADVHPKELCPPNKRYDLMDANKKVDLDHVQCPPESKILTNIIKNHPLRFSIAASSSVPWIYMAQFWHTLKEDGSKYRLKFMLDKKELSLTLDDFRTIFL